MPLRCFRRRYWKYCTKGMRTVLYNMLGCESFISRSFRPFPRGGEQKTMIVFSFLNSGCERSGGWYGKQGGNGWATGPSFLQKSCKKAVKFIISRLFVVDLIGIEPTTLRMRTVRSPSWAIGPYLVVLYIFARFVCAVCCSGRARVMLRWLSQLSYGPILAIFHRKKLWKTDFQHIRFWGKIMENQTSEWEESHRYGM